MRIGLLSYRSNPFSGGQGIYIKHLSEALKDLGHDVDVISGPPYPLLRKDINLIKIPSLDLFAEENRLRTFKTQYFINLTDLTEWFGILTGGFPEPYTFGKRVKIYLEKRKDSYDILHDNQSLSYSMLKLQEDFPLVSTIHHPITKDHRLEIENSKNWKERLSSNRWHSFLKMQKFVAPRLKKIICPSRQSRKDVIDEFEANPDSVEVIPNGIDLKTFKINKLVKKIPYRIVTTASADIPLKGLRYLVNALNNVIKIFPVSTLAVIGKTKEGGEVKRQIDRLNLGEKISFYSDLSESEIVNLYSSSQLAVIPSLYEGFGFGAGEAMACGVPLISTHSGGLKEVVGEAAIEVKPGDSDDLTTAILDLFSSPDKQDHFSKIGRKRINDQFQWNKAAKEYIKIYEEIVDKFPN
tara:strand:- start:169 stop:1398 length:1230 start_codon:yes stop_codon:yes gene_type:complete